MIEVLPCRVIGAITTGNLAERSQKLFLVAGADEKEDVDESGDLGSQKENAYKSRIPRRALQVSVKSRQVVVSTILNKRSSDAPLSL